MPSRHEPDEGEIDYRAVIKLIESKGWAGWIGAEYLPRRGTEEGLRWRERLLARARGERPTIALIAHDRKKPAIADWVEMHREILSNFDLVCTGTTGEFVASRCPDLNIVSVKSGPLGGDQQIGALITKSEIQMLIFFTDPLSAHPHDVDVKALTRLATVYDLPMACSPSTASLIIKSWKSLPKSHVSQNP